MFRIRSSVTQRRQQPRERQHEGSGYGTTTKKNHGFIFMPGEDQGVAPVLAPGRLGKVRRKG